MKVNDEKFSKAIDNGTDPSASDVAQLQNDIKGKILNYLYTMYKTPA